MFAYLRLIEENLSIYLQLISIQPIHQKCVKSESSPRSSHKIFQCAIATIAHIIRITIQTILTYQSYIT